MEIAIYDMRLEGAAAATLQQAVTGAIERGVAARIVFNQDHAKPIPVPPPAAVDWDLLKRIPWHFQPINGMPDLMHHKYVVRDAERPEAAVWTGSTNWTTDSWTREENVIVRVTSPEVAQAYRTNFEELWQYKDVARSGHFTPPEADVTLDGGAARLRPVFSPGRAHKMVHDIAQRIAGAARRLRICSPVLTSGPILATLAEVAGRQGLDASGVFDLTQMRQVQYQWEHGPSSGWKTGVFQSVIARMPFGAKASTPYESGSVHDFMHAKLVVADDCVFTGSFNLSHSGESNAENVLMIENAGVADEFAAYVDRVRARYPMPS